MTTLNNRKVFSGGFVCQVDIVDPYHEDFWAHHFEDVCLHPYCTHVRFILCHTEKVERKAALRTCYQLAACSAVYRRASELRGESSPF